MNHQDVVNGEIADQYVAGTLAPGAKEAFEEHFFECDDCFAAVEAGDRLRSGIRQLAAAGDLDARPVVAPMPVAVSAGRGSLAPWLLAAAAVVLAVAGGWLARSRTSDLQRQLQAAEKRSAVLEQTLAQMQTGMDALTLQSAAAGAQANLPLAILQTTRAPAATVTLTVPRDARQFVVWLEDPPKSDGGTADLTLTAPDGRVIATLAGLRRNEQGAIVASFPASGITSGRYGLRLSNPDRRLADYRLAITRQP